MNFFGRSCREFNTVLRYRASAQHCGGSFIHVSCFIKIILIRLRCQICKKEKMYKKQNGQGQLAT